MTREKLWGEIIAKITMPCSVLCDAGSPAKNITSTPLLHMRNFRNNRLVQRPGSGRQGFRSHGNRRDSNAAHHRSGTDRHRLVPDQFSLPGAPSQDRKSVV